MHIMKRLMEILLLNFKTFLSFDKEVFESIITIMEAKYDSRAWNIIKIDGY